MGRLMIMVVSPASRTETAPTEVRQAKNPYITASAKQPTESMKRKLRAELFWVKKSTKMCPRWVWHQGKHMEMARAMPIWVNSTSPGMGVWRKARMNTLVKVMKPVSKAKPAPITPNQRLKGMNQWATLNIP